MPSFISIVDILFTFALILNGTVFIPQFRKMYRIKSAEGSSLITFVGFNFTQVLSVLHGYQHQDWILFGGMLYSFLTCLACTILIFYYQKIKRHPISIAL